MPVYNLTLINGSGVLPFVQTVNTNLMEGWFGTLMIIALFAIVFMSINGRIQEPGRSFSLAALICAVISLPLLTLNLVTIITVWVAWGLAVLSMGFIFFTKEGQ